MIDNNTPATQAEAWAAAHGHDGLTDPGEPPTEVRVIPRLTNPGGEPTGDARWEWDDGSAVVLLAPGWDLGFTRSQVVDGSAAERMRMRGAAGDPEHVWPEAL